MTKHLTALLTLATLATITASAQTICLPVDGQPTQIGPLPAAYGRYSNPKPEHMQPDGWRLYAPNGTANIKASDWADDGTMFTQVVTAVWSAAELAQQAADAAAAAAIAESNRLATPLIYDQPIQAKIETLAADGHIYGIEVDPSGDEIIPVQRESTRLTQAEYEAARAIKLAERATHRANLHAIKTDLDQVETALDRIDVSASGSYATNIAACTGATKTALQDTRKVLVDVKAALKNLRQAAEKIRKEIR